jgi:PAS domain S-box-containing protein
MPQRELERLQAVNRFLKLEFNKEKELQEIVNLAASICDTPTALITLINDNTQYIKFKTGFDLDSINREDAFCNYTINQNEVMVVNDALLDGRFADNPLMVGDKNIRFYAGSPLTTQDGYKLGSLCVMAREPKDITADQQRMLEVLAKQVIHLLEFDASLGILKEQFIKARNSEIKLQSFFESSSACHLLLNTELEVLAFNKATSRFVEKNYKTKLMAGMKVTDYMHDAHLPAFVGNCQAALSGETVRIERQFIYDEEIIWWSVTYEPAYNPDGEIVGVSYNATDITRMMESEQRIGTQTEALNTIAYIQAHEMRKPVASILGLINLFKLQDYTASREELLMLERAAEEMDEKIKTIIRHAAQ